MTTSHSFGEALVVRQANGTIVVERADDVILVSNELLDVALPSHYADGVLTLDTAAEYRYRRLRTHDAFSVVFERIHEEA